jgi:hypothetical protein
MWKEGDPVQVTKSLNLPRFTLQKYLTKYCTSRTNTGIKLYQMIYSLMNYLTLINSFYQRLKEFRAFHTLTMNKSFS